MKTTKKTRSVVAAKVSHATAAGPSETRPSYEQVAQRAYQLYEQEGRLAGRDVQHWLQAEAELLSQT